MQIKLTTQQSKQLIEQGLFKKYQTGKYLTDSTNGNYQYIKEKLFTNESLTTANLLMRGSGMYESVCDTFADKVGEPMVMVGDNIKVSTKIDVKSMVKDFVSISFFCM